MSTKIEARRCSEKTEAQSRKSGQRYEIAVKAVFADLGRCSEHDKTKNFDVPPSFKSFLLAATMLEKTRDAMCFEDSVKSCMKALTTSL